MARKTSRGRRMRRNGNDGIDLAEEHLAEAHKRIDYAARHLGDDEISGMVDALVYAKYNLGRAATRLHMLFFSAGLDQAERGHLASVAARLDAAEEEWMRIYVGFLHDL